MIVPSIDLQNSHAVQLVGGRELEIDAGDPRPIARKFRLAGDIAVIDLDAAMSKGNNATVIHDLLKIARCRVGGGIRSVEKAMEWLDAGAHKIILGTAARPEILRELPRERVIAALDAVDGEVVVEGWTEGTGRGIAERMRELKPFVSGFLVTFVEREGRMGGTAMDRVAELVEICGDECKLTIAGGVTTVEEIAQLDAMGVDAQVGMALYKDEMKLGDAISACLKSDRPDGLVPTVVADEGGRTLGLAYSDTESIRVAVERQVGAYHSRRRGLWVKGETSGNTQELVAIDTDCDRDALRFTVRQSGPFCHLGTDGCFGDLKGLAALEQTIWDRKESSPEGSYTRRLFEDADLLGAKIREEADELTTAESAEEVAWEAADLLYFAMVRMAANGVKLSDVERVLDARAKKVKRRRGDAKEKYTKES